MNYVRHVVINGKVYYSIADLTAFKMDEPKKVEDQNIVELNGAFYLNLDEEPPKLPPEKELSEFDKTLKGIMEVPKPKK